MGRAGPRSGLLIGAVCGLTVAAAAAGGAPPLRAMRWLAPGADASVLLTRRKPECLRTPVDPREAYEVELGRAAVRSPLNLGGQAARSVVACDTCHQNGRTNPDFDFPGISGAPGTADVTNFLFSPKRGNHVGVPRPIPDLGGPKSALKVSQAPGSPDLERFIHGLVTEEFDGAVPPPAVMAGLAAYVRALGPDACPPASSEPLRVAAPIADARRAVRAALEALARDDRASAAVMIEAARAQWGNMADRYPASATPGAREALQVAGVDLAADLADVRAGAPIAERLTVWLGRSKDWAARLEADEPRSLYNPAVLASAS